ncbi:MAG: hypothetical protein COB02_09915 [Candidatus Cloacimonadota bacterium]|nr:MAG: hypothetical protein COB02_09915 [Candidatus Cloacimonadota bacterium]
MKNIQKCLELGQFNQAKELCLSKLKQNQNNQEALFLLAQSYSFLNLLEQSISIFNKLIQLNPKSANHYSNLSVILLKNNQSKLALENLQLSIKLDPKSSCTYFNLGNTYQYLNDYQSTIKNYKKAIQIQPNYVKAISNLAAFYLKHLKLDKSLKLLLKCIQLDPICLAAHLNLSNIYRELHQEQKAISHAIEAYKIAPDDIEVLSNFNHISLTTCLWTETKIVWEHLDQMNQSYIAQNIPMIEPPFLNISRVDDPSANLQIAKHTTKFIQVEKSKFRVIPLPKNDEKIKIGYMSGDFKDHPVGQAVLKLFENHSDNFESYAISFGKDDQSHIRKYILGTCSEFIDIEKLSHHEAAKKIHQLKLHILVDLSGHTKRNRMEIFAFKPARIQVHYLGFAASTGASFFDYMIADKTVIPIGETQFYSEKIAYLPNYYHLIDDSITISNKFKSKADIGLPENKFIFTSHCSKYKITPDMFQAWITILKEVSNSIIWLSDCSDYCKQNLINTFITNNINPNRIYFAEFLENKSDHLNRLQFADLALDTYPYNGHTTTNDALFCGLPVLTTQGKHFASRVSESLLHELGLDELATNSLDTYIQKAIFIAKNKDLLNKYKDKIKLNFSVFKCSKLVNNLEHLYLKMIEDKKSNSNSNFL